MHVSNESAFWNSRAWAFVCSHADGRVLFIFTFIHMFIIYVSNSLFEFHLILKMTFLGSFCCRQGFL